MNNNLHLASHGRPSHLTGFSNMTDRALDFPVNLPGRFSVFPITSRNCVHYPDRSFLALSWRFDLPGTLI
jgi:hypothetical protein